MFPNVVSDDAWSSSWFVLIPVIVVTTWYLWGRATSRLPPGPRPLPLLGNILALRRAPRPQEYFQELGRTFGSVFTIYFGPKPVVVLNDHEAITHALIDKATEFAGRPWSMVGEVGLESGSDVAFADYSPGWSVRRRLLMVALKKFGDKNTVSHLVCESTVDACRDMLRETAAAGKVTGVQRKLYLLMYNVICSILFGKKFEADDADFAKLRRNTEVFNEYFGATFLGDVFPILKHVPTAATRRVREVCRDSQAYFAARLGEHAATLDESAPRDISDALLLARAQMVRDGERDIALFTDVHQRFIIGDIFAGGTDTTCFTIHWALLYCIHHTELQERMFKEIQSQVGTNRMILAEDKPRLPYTDAFLLEVMRIRPIGPLGLPHSTTCDVHLHGYLIPKGTMVLPNIWSAHHSPAHWPHPERFLPERFLDATTGAVRSGKPAGFLAFGCGKRSCAGEHLARLDIFLVFATFLQRLRFAAVDPVSLPALEPGEQAANVFCVPRPYDMVVTGR